MFGVVDRLGTLFSTTNFYLIEWNVIHWNQHSTIYFRLFKNNKKKTFFLNLNKIITILCVSFIAIKILYLTLPSYNCHNMGLCPLLLPLLLLKFLILFLFIKVCEEQSCEDQVFPLSVNFLDRFLCACDISKTHLQLTGAVCLLLASKVRQCTALSIELLCYYTENSVTPEEMRVNISDEIIF